MQRSSKTACSWAFSSRAESRSVPNGFSVITRAPSPSPAAPRLSIVGTAAAGRQREVEEDARLAAELLARGGDRRAPAARSPSPTEAKRSDSAKRSHSAASSALRPEPSTESRASSRNSPSSIGLRAAPMIRKRSGIRPDPGEVEHPRQQLAFGEVAGRAEEDDHLVLGDGAGGGGARRGRGDAHDPQADRCARLGWAVRDICLPDRCRPRRRTVESAFDPLALDSIERRFWRDVWELGAGRGEGEHGIELRAFGPVQATVVGDLAEVGMLNLVLGATEPGAVADGSPRRSARVGSRARRLTVRPAHPGPVARAPRPRAWLAANGLLPGYSVDEIRPRRPPSTLPRRRRTSRCSSSTAGDGEPFGMIAANGFGMPAWAAAFFAELPGREGWRCYGARVDGELGACGGDGDRGRHRRARRRRDAGAGPAPRLPSWRCCTAASSTPRRPGVTPSSSRPASGSRTDPRAATGTSCAPGSRRPTCARTGRPSRARSRASSVSALNTVSDAADTFRQWMTFVTLARGFGF